MVYAPAMELRQESTITATLVFGQPSKPMCQVNVGTHSDPRPCGAKMTKVNDWTLLCPEHGEMY